MNEVHIMSICPRIFLETAKDVLKLETTKNRKGKMNIMITRKIWHIVHCAR